MNLRHTFTDVKQLSDGAMGVTNTVMVKGNEVVMKYSLEIDNHDSLHEICIGLALNELRRKIPTFMFVYGGFYCSPPLSLRDYTNSPNPMKWWSEFFDTNKLCDPNEIPTSLMLCEYITDAVDLHTFKDMMIKGLWGSGVKVTKSDIDNVLLQIFMAMYMAVREFDFIHGDLNPGNVLVKYFSTPLMINYEEFNVKIKTHYVVSIIDYGLSAINVNGKLLTTFNEHNADYVTKRLDFMAIVGFVDSLPMYGIYDNAFSRGVREKVTGRGLPYKNDNYFWKELIQDFLQHLI
jgi:serine/threonine protein kinase